jgi:hypothetical protein
MKSSAVEERADLEHRVARALRAHGLRRSVEVSQRRRDSGMADEPLRAIDCRLRSYPDPLAYLTPERFERNRKAGREDSLGTGPRLAPRR